MTSTKAVVNTKSLSDGNCYTISEMMMFRDKAPALSQEDRDKIYRCFGIRIRNKRMLINETLNKLVKENAMDLTEDLEDIMFEETIEMHEYLAECMFKKAIQEQMFVDVHAMVCKNLNSLLEVPPKNGKSVTFKSLLLRKCQNLFDRGIGELNEMKKKEKELSEEEKAEYEEELFKKKKNYLGVILFIAALYKQCMVPIKIVTEGCLKHLFIRIRTEHDFSCIEPIHKLLMNIGAQLEKDAGKFKGTVDNVYAQLKSIKDDPLIGKRDSFMIDDILETRQKWINNGGASSSKPSTTTSTTSTATTTTKTVPFAINSVTVIRNSGSTTTTTFTTATATATRKSDDKPVEQHPVSKTTVDAVRNQIRSSLDEYMENNNRKELYTDFDEEVIRKGFMYMLIPSVFNYCVEKNLSENDTKDLTSALSGYGAFKSSERKDLAKGVDELLNVLQDVEDVTETVISQFSMFMSIILCHLNFCIAAEFVNCLYNLRDYDPFCSLKEKRKYGVSALFFVGTLSAIHKVNPVQAKKLKDRTKDSAKIFNNEEQRKALYEMYNLTPLL